MRVPDQTRRLPSLTATACGVWCVMFRDGVCGSFVLSCVCSCGCGCCCFWEDRGALRGLFVPPPRACFNPFPESFWGVIVLCRQRSFCDYSPYEGSYLCHAGAD